MFVGLPFEYLNLFFHLFTFKGDKGRERNEKFIISFSSLYMIWDAFHLLLRFFLSSSTRLDFIAEENNNKLRDKALKFYLIFVYFLLDAISKNEKFSFEGGIRNENTSLHLSSASASHRLLSEIFKKVFWLKMEELTVMVRN